MPLLAAPFVGSLLGVLIRRLPRGQPVVFARSACEHCGRHLGPLELLPLASFVIQRGRCRGCKTAIPWMHFAIELAALAVAGIAVAIAVVTGLGDDEAAEVAAGTIWAGCVLGWTLLALAWIDAEWMLLPDALTLPLIVAGLLAAWLQQPWTITDRAAGAIVGYAILRAVEVGYRRLRGRDGLGEGDAKLLAAAGAWLGWQALPWVMVLAALVALVAAGAMALRGREMRRDTALPFGPPLAAATWTLWLVTQLGM